MIYRRLLQSDFDSLPHTLRDFHSGTGHRRATGTATVRHASRLARILGFPPAGDDIPVQLDVFARQDSEVWNRRFGGVLRRSVQWLDGPHLVEDAGPVRIYFRVFRIAEGIEFQSVRARLLGIPLPLRVTATVQCAGPAWEFEVSIAPLGSYHGIMEPQA